MARLDMALADVALAKQLAATLADLPRPCGALRSQLVAAAAGPPWVKYVLFDAERGIALLDFTPGRPSRGIEPLKTFLAETGFANRYPGELPVVAVELAPDEIPMVAERIAAAFAAGSPCAIKDTSWCEAVNRLLMTAEGLVMARVMPAPGAAAAGPVRLAEVGPGASASPATRLQSSILERPFLQQPLPETPSLKRPILERAFLQQQMPERPAPTRAPLQKLLLRKRDRERSLLQKPVLEKPILGRPILEEPKTEKHESRPGFAGNPARWFRSWGSGDYPRAALAIAALSVGTLAIGAVSYLLDAASPAAQAPTAIRRPIEAAAPQISVPAVRSATATEGSAVATPLFVGVADVSSIPEETAAVSARQSAALMEAAPPNPATPIRSAEIEGDAARQPQADAAEPLPATTAVRSAAAFDGAAAASEPSAIAAEQPPALASPEVSSAEAVPPTPPSVRSAAAIEGDAGGPFLVSEAVEPFSIVAEAPPVWARPSRPAARALPAKSAAATATQEPTPIWRDVPVRAAGRVPYEEFVMVTRTRDTR